MTHHTVLPQTFKDAEEGGRLEGMDGPIPKKKSFERTMRIARLTGRKTNDPPMKAEDDASLPVRFRVHGRILEDDLQAMARTERAVQVQVEKKRYDRLSERSWKENTKKGTQLA